MYFNFSSLLEENKDCYMPKLSTMIYLFITETQKIIVTDTKIISR
jgi:hypothetical protein